MGSCDSRQVVRVSLSRVPAALRLMLGSLRSEGDQIMAPVGGVVMAADTAGRSTRTLGDAMEIAWRSRALQTGDLFRSGAPRAGSPNAGPTAKLCDRPRPVRIPRVTDLAGTQRPRSPVERGLRVGTARPARQPPVRRADRCGACCPPVSGHPDRGGDRQVKGVAAVLTYPPWRVEIVSDGRGCVPGRRAAGRSPRGDESRGRRSRSRERSGVTEPRCRTHRPRRSSASWFPEIERLTFTVRSLA
jgi:hypothetical protein